MSRPSEEQDCPALTKRQRAFMDKLYRDWFDALYGYAKILLRHRDMAEAAVDETLLTACKKAGQLQTHSNIPGWLYTTLRYTICNIRRDMDRTCSLCVPLQSLENLEDTTSPSFSELELDIIGEQLLGKQEYQIFKAFTLKKMTILDAAQAMNISVEQCKKRIQRSRKKLERHLLEDDAPDVPRAAHKKSAE